MTESTTSAGTMAALAVSNVARHETLELIGLTGAVQVHSLPLHDDDPRE
jgi:hypothetical protein